MCTKINSDSFDNVSMTSILSVTCKAKNIGESKILEPYSNYDDVSVMKCKLSKIT